MEESSYDNQLPMKLDARSRITKGENGMAFQNTLRRKARMRVGYACEPALEQGIRFNTRCARTSVGDPSKSQP